MLSVLAFDVFDTAFDVSDAAFDLLSESLIIHENFINYSWKLINYS